jgi:inorganic pyrophosphatase
MKSPDHKILAVALDDPKYGAFNEAAELPLLPLAMLKRFFVNYKYWKTKTLKLSISMPPGLLSLPSKRP